MKIRKVCLIIIALSLVSIPSSCLSSSLAQRLLEDDFIEEPIEEVAESAPVVQWAYEVVQEELVSFEGKYYWSALLWYEERPFYIVLCCDINKYPSLSEFKKQRHGDIMDKLKQALHRSKDI